jgi:hypothetical protein
MSAFDARGRTRSTLLLLAAAVAGAILLLAPRSTHAATRTVTNCNNSGSGSLRAAAAVALSGDTIDLSRLSCTRITLASEVLLPQGDIRLLGRDRLALTLFGNHATRVLHHTGNGTLSVERLSVSYGVVTGERALGGCIESARNVTLREARAHHCLADAGTGDLPIALGGAIHAAGFVLLDHSSVFENQARAIAEADGGGVDSGGRTTLLHSQVYNNSADSGGGVLAENGFRMVYSILQGNLAREEGGGAYTQGNVEVTKSTVSGNHSNDSGGGIAFHNGPVLDALAVIADSTISGNSADDRVSALAFVSARGSIYNSTITANHETTTDTCWGAIFTFGMRMESTVVSANVCDATDGPRDLGDLPSQPASVTGSHNLVGSSGVSMPGDTLFSDTPGLGPLALNGGPTRTHAVLSGSLLIDRGNNVLNRIYDQRGAPFARVRGPAADIGAFER